MTLTDLQPILKITKTVLGFISVHSVIDQSNKHVCKSETTKSIFNSKRKKTKKNIEIEL